MLPGTHKLLFLKSIFRWSIAYYKHDIQWNLFFFNQVLIKRFNNAHHFLTFWKWRLGDGRWPPDNRLINRHSYGLYYRFSNIKWSITTRHCIPYNIWWAQVNFLLWGFRGLKIMTSRDTRYAGVLFIRVDRLTRHQYGCRLPENCGDKVPFPIRIKTPIFSSLGHGCLWKWSMHWFQIRPPDLVAPPVILSRTRFSQLSP